MSKKKDDKAKDAEQVAEVKADAKAPAAAPVAETKADVKKDSVEKAKPDPLITFSRFFAHTGKPDHHKSGMAVWLQKRGGTNGRRTDKSWTDLFAKY